MKSSWEVKVGKYFDSLLLDWKYEYITYPLSNGTTYTPDFFVFQCDKIVDIIEVKGWWSDTSKMKMELFRQEYQSSPIKILDKKELIQLKIL